MKARIILSALALLLLFTACAADSDDERVTSTSSSIRAPEAVTAFAPVTRCGLWIADSAALAELRHAAAPTNPDMLVQQLPGGLACSALERVRPQLETDWAYGGYTPGHAVLYYIVAPGFTADGIGTSPSGPRIDDGDGL